MPHRACFQTLFLQGMLTYKLSCLSAQHIFCHATIILLKKATTSVKGFQGISLTSCRRTDRLPKEVWQSKGVACWYSVFPYLLRNRFGYLSPFTCREDMLLIALFQLVDAYSLHNLDNTSDILHNHHHNNQSLLLYNLRM